MATTQTISIPRCTGRCALEDRDLNPGEGIVVVLHESVEDEALIRTDYALEAWKRAELKPDPSRFASWRAVAPHPDRKTDGIISANGLLDLFEQLEGTEDPKRRAFRYVLALQLMRKRLLEYAGTRDGVLLLKSKTAEEGDPPIEVHDPQATGELDEAALADLAEQVELLLDTGDAS